MDIVLALRMATLKNHFLLTAAPHLRICPLTYLKSISLHCHTLAKLAAMEHRQSHPLASPAMKSTSSAPVFRDIITMKKWCTHRTWTWLTAISHNKLIAHLKDMNTGVKTLLDPTRGHRDLYLLISDMHPLHSCTIHTTTSVVCHNK